MSSQSSPLDQPADAEHVAAKPILPGATIGMVGGGQLGRMFAMAAASMGYDVIVFCDSPDDPAAQVAHRAVVGDLRDAALTEAFAAECDVITLEFENIPAETIARCASHAPTYPDASVLATAQDRLIEKTTLQEAGLPVTPFVEVSDVESATEAGDTLGWPLIIKTARSGYDGKGQHRIDSAAEAAEVPWRSADQWIAEKCIPFEREASIVVARSASGRRTCFPVFENRHRNHILDLTIVPAALSDAMRQRAQEIALKAAETLDVVGLLCVELFIAGDQVLINEVAPRPHNSGHLTIEACHTSQFQQHVRAVCDLPLGETSLQCEAAAMVNLLGDLWGADGSPPPWDAALAIPAVNLHLYGKQVAKAGRKMGHLTATGRDRDGVVQRVTKARDQLA